MKKKTKSAWFDLGKGLTLHYDKGSILFEKKKPTVTTQHGLDTDAVNHPPHYTKHPSGVECIAITEHFCSNLGNVIKYIWRADEKGFPVQDLKKAAFYLNREIERRGKSVIN